MRADWKVSTLGDTCEIYQPKTISKKEMSEDGAYPVFGANGVIGRYHNFNHVEPQLLITCRGATCGSVNVSEPRSWITGNAMVVRPKIADLDLRFLEFFCRGGIDLNGVITGAAQPQITRKSLSPVLVPLPPLEEQQRIVAVLDEAFEGLARARIHADANLQNARELLAEMISRCFDRSEANGSSVQALGKMADFRNGLNFSRASTGAEIKVVGVGDFKDNFEVPVGDLSSVTIDGDLAEVDRLHTGDVLAVRSNGNRELIGRTMVVPTLDEPVSFSGFTIRIRLKTEKLSPEYLCEFMKTREARAKLAAGGGGANISNLNQKLLAGFSIQYPGRSEQRRILDELAAIRNQALLLVDQYQDQLDDLDDLRQSLLQKAFSGELT